MITTPNVKINLGLNVLRRRPDGYHDLETLFVPYKGIHDTLEIIDGDSWSETSASLINRYGNLSQAISPDGKVMISIAKAGGVGWEPLTDLTVKAYQMLAADYKLPPVKIYLEKTSPLGAGLGGGSADGAFALRMLSEIAGLGLSDDTLAAYASRLGSDCAFFIYNRPMFGRGRGEILTPWESPVPDNISVTVPDGIAVSTADAYRGIIPGIPPLPLREVLQLPVSQWKELLHNDFETSVFAKYPAMAAIKASLYEKGATYAAMSGSGSALFSIN